MLHLYLICFCDNSTATLNAPSSAVSCIFSEPPSESRCLRTTIS